MPCLVTTEPNPLIVQLSLYPAVFLLSSKKLEGKKKKKKFLVKHTPWQSLNPFYDLSTNTLMSTIIIKNRQSWLKEFLLVGMTRTDTDVIDTELVI